MPITVLSPEESQPQNPQRPQDSRTSEKQITLSIGQAITIISIAVGSIASIAYAIASFMVTQKSVEELKARNHEILKSIDELKQATTKLEVSVQFFEQTKPAADENTRALINSKTGLIFVVVIAVVNIAAAFTLVERNRRQVATLRTEQENLQSNLRSTRLLYNRAAISARKLMNLAEAKHAVRFGLGKYTRDSTTSKFYSSSETFNFKYNSPTCPGEITVSNIRVWAGRSTEFENVSSIVSATIAYQKCKSKNFDSYNVSSYYSYDRWIKSFYPDIDDKTRVYIHAFLGEETEQQAIVYFLQHDKVEPIGEAIVSRQN